MNKAWIIVLAVSLLAVQGYCEEAVQAPKEFGGVATGVVTLSAVVESIDYATRDITLKGPEGNTVTVKAGPEVRNFAQIKKGDKVNVDYSQTVKILVKGTPSLPERQESLALSRAPLGERPAGLMIATTQVNATVEAIDYEKGMVTVKGPERIVVVQVNKDEAPNFNQVKVGDTVYLEFTELLAISVTP